MHMQRDPQTMQFNPEYKDVNKEVIHFLKECSELLIQKGIDQNRIAIDPGFGFGKSLEHNLKMLADFDQFSQLGYPVLAGISRKSMLGKLTGRDTNDRVAPSIAAAILAADRGARIIGMYSKDNAQKNPLADQSIAAPAAHSRPRLVSAKPRSLAFS